MDWNSIELWCFVSWRLTLESFRFWGPRRKKRYLSDYIHHFCPGRFFHDMASLVIFLICLYMSSCLSARFKPCICQFHPSSKFRQCSDLTALQRLTSREMRMKSQPNRDDNGNKDTLKEVMLNSIKWYRNTLSPLMPPNCRFLPTCSQYGLESIEKFGPLRGGILTAWRIFRCNPLGGSGYDAPVWPPPSYFAGSNTFRRWKFLSNDSLCRFLISHVTTSPS